MRTGRIVRVFKKLVKGDINKMVIVRHKIEQNKDILSLDIF